MSKLYSKKMIYAAKQLLSESAEKMIGFTCADTKMNTAKNQDISTVYNVLSKESKNILLLNLDPEFSADFSYIDAPVKDETISYDLETALKGTDVSQYDKILVNFCPTQNKGYLFDPNIAVKEIVLCVKYGATTYTNFEKSVDLFTQNGIRLIGTLAHK